MYISAKGVADIYEASSQYVSGSGGGGGGGDASQEQGPRCVAEAKPCVSHIDEEGRVVFEDGSAVVADDLAFCTGYSYDFGFVDDSILKVVEDKRVTPLFEHVLHTKWPTLAVIGWSPAPSPTAVVPQYRYFPCAPSVTTGW